MAVVVGVTDNSEKRVFYGLPLTSRKVIDYDYHVFVVCGW